MGDRDSNTTPCLRGVLAPKNLIQAFDKDDMSFTSPNTRNGGFKRTLSMIDNGIISHDNKKMRLQFLDPECDEFLFKHPNPMSARLDQTDQTLVHIFDLLLLIIIKYSFTHNIHNLFCILQ